MAERLLKYYKYISSVKGMQGSIQLAVKTNIPSPKAAMEPDSDANIAAFRKACKELTGEESPVY